MSNTYIYWGEVVLNPGDSYFKSALVLPSKSLIIRPVTPGIPVGRIVAYASVNYAFNLTPSGTVLALLNSEPVTPRGTLLISAAPTVTTYGWTLHLYCIRRTNQGPVAFRIWEQN